MTKRHILTASHWGVGSAETENGQLAAVHPHPADPSPSKINENIASSLNGKARVLRPAVRESWLQNGPGAKRDQRGRDRFIEVSWDQVNELIAGELTRVKENHGNRAIFGGSYGWGSAGRFHHAQSQLKRFLNACGGFVNSMGNYSYHSAIVLMPHIVMDFYSHLKQTTRWSVIADHSDLVLLFGGVAARNAQVAAGGIAQHRLPYELQYCAERGVRFVNISPLRSDVADRLGAEWIPPKPGSDVAIMMGMAHTLLTENLHDQEFLEHYTSGFETLAAMLTGEVDGVEKTPEWAERESGVPAKRIRTLAREAAAGRTMISTAASLQRADYGEQAVWMTVALAAMLGQIGLPGGGYGIAYGSDAAIGVADRPFRWPSLPQGQNPVKDFIPVAMISDMLLNPGQPYEFNGTRAHFPDIRLVWWAGGNPFHHHQDLNRLRKAFQRPETIIVNEINWTATAKHADIVLPVAAAPERNDFAAGNQDNSLVPMRKCVEPPAEARAEYEIYTELEQMLGLDGCFSEGLTETGWLKRLWNELRDEASTQGQSLPTFDDFMSGEILTLPDLSNESVLMADFRADPQRCPLPTPSGRIELASEKIANFNYDDCPGHPCWFPPRDRLLSNSNSYPLALLSGQPEGRLHSQFDNGSFSKSLKINGREPILIHPKDASARQLHDGDLVEVFNDRGRCLASVKTTEDIREGVVFIWTGAWFDPDDNDPSRVEKHGNPNVLTHDLRTSRLSQGPAAQSAYVQVQLLLGDASEVTAHDPPQFATGKGSDQWEGD